MILLSQLVSPEGMFAETAVSFIAENSRKECRTALAADGYILNPRKKKLWNCLSPLWIKAIPLPQPHKEPQPAFLLHRQPFSCEIMSILHNLNKQSSLLRSGSGLFLSLISSCGLRNQIYSSPLNCFY